jgi:hypothetical protein
LDSFLGQQPPKLSKTNKPVFFNTTILNSHVFPNGGLDVVIALQLLFPNAGFSSS